MAFSQSTAKKIKLLILDVDGVLTDGRIIYCGNEEIKNFHAHDGLGIKLLKSTGVEVAIISARTSQAVEKRAKELHISHCYLGQTDKTIAFHHLLKTLDLKPEQAAYVGDDLADLKLLKQVGMSITVSNATHLAKAAADWQTIAAGGFGAVREICEAIMQAQDTFEKAIACYQ